MSRYFWPILTPLPLSHFVTPPRTPQKFATHLVPPIFSSRHSTKNPDKSPMYKFSLNCSRGLLSGCLLSGRFCPGWLCPYPLPSEYICYNRKLKITLYFICVIKNL